jgi:hypothetical protein
VIANKMADAVGVEFESRATHFRFSMDKKINAQYKLDSTPTHPNP